MMQSRTCCRWQGHHRRGPQLQGRYEDQAQAYGAFFVTLSVSRAELNAVSSQNNFPHVQLVDLSFNQPPEFDFVLKPVGFDLSIVRPASCSLRSFS